MAVTEAHTRASVKYNKARDNIMIRADAAAAGQSLQAYILQACQERRERDASK